MKKKNERIKNVCFKVPHERWLKLKIYAAKSGITLQEALTEVLDVWIVDQEKRG